MSVPSSVSLEQRFRYRPADFMKLVVPFGKPGPFESWTKPWDVQVELLESIGDEMARKRFGPDANGEVTPRERVERIVSSCTGAGKTSLMLPTLVCWQVMCWPHSKGVAVSTTREQLYDKFFSATKALIDSSPILREYLDYDESMTVWRKGRRPTQFCAYRTALEEAAALGSHAHGSLGALWIDEAAGPKDTMFRAYHGLLHDPQVVCVAFGNPLKPWGWFFDRHSGRLFKAENVRVISARDLPTWTQDREDKALLDAGGEDETEFRVFFLGLPPLVGSGAFISTKVCEASMNAPLFHNGKPVVPSTTPLVVGLDLAGEGEAQNCAVFRAGIDMRSLAPLKVKGSDIGPLETVAWAVDIVSQAQGRYGRPVVCYYDSTGDRGMFYEQLKRAGVEDKFRPVNFGASGGDRHLKMRSLMYEGLKVWMTRGGAIRNDRGLLRTITAATGEFNANGKYVMIPKEEIAATAGKSHLDEVDAMLLACLAAPPVDADFTPAAGALRRQPTRRSWAEG